MNHICNSTCTYLSLGSITFISFAACTSGEFLNESSGSFSSPNYPNSYPQYSRCTWNITVPSENIIKVSFLYFKLDPYRCGVREASIVITNVISNDRNKPLKLFSGSLPHPVYSVGNSIQVIFTSLTKQYSGFNATYMAIQRTASRSY